MENETLELVKKAAARVEALTTENATLKGSATELSERMSELERLAVTPRGKFNTAAKSAGHQFIESDSFNNLVRAERGKASLSLKSTLTLSGTSAGSMVVPDHLAGVESLPFRKISIRDVLSSGSTNSSSVEFVKQTGRTNAAATVAETLTKPEATLTYMLQNAPVRTIAVTLPASRQILSDAPMLQSMIDAELTYMLRDVEERQILSGDGSGSNILGIIPQSTAFVAPFTIASPTMIDKLLLALAQSEALNYTPDFIALNPLDWRLIQSLKDTMGRYLANGPFNADQVARLWSTRIVPTQGIDVDKFLVGDGARGAQVFDRWQSRVEISTEHLDFFAKNLVMMLAEERLALCVFHPDAFIYGDFGNVP